MPAWATVVLTLGASAIAAAAALAATWMQNRHSDDQERRRSEAERRERAGQVLGRVVTLLHDLRPTEFEANLDNPRSAAVFDDLNGRWCVLRDELAVFWTTEGTREIVELASPLQGAIANTINRLGWLVYSRQPGASRYTEGQDRDLLDSATEHYAEAQALTARLLQALHPAGHQHAAA